MNKRFKIPWVLIRLKVAPIHSIWISFLNARKVAKNIVVSVVVFLRVSESFVVVVTIQFYQSLGFRMVILVVCRMLIVS